MSSQPTLPSKDHSSCFVMSVDDHISNCSIKRYKGGIGLSIDHESNDNDGMIKLLETFEKIMKYTESSKHK